MTDVTQVHEQNDTLQVEVNIPGHEARKTTALFEHSKKALMERDGARCFICGDTAEQSGHPLESHHNPVERSLANMFDWELFAADAEHGAWGPYAQSFDWDKFFEGAERVTVDVPEENGEPAFSYAYLKPVDPMLFVDDQTVNGLILCKAHHTGRDEGIHAMPYPLWLAQKYGIEGYRFSAVEVIHHEG